MKPPFISHAQNAEDVVLMRGLSDVRHGVYVDVGAADPDQDNVTRAFYARGWRGLNIEPDLGAFRRLVDARPRDRNLNVGIGNANASMTYHHFPNTGYSTFCDAQAAQMIAEGFEREARAVQVITLDEAIREAKLERIHFLKIDVEGFERQVLEGIDLTRTRPWIIVIEATRPGTNELVDDGWRDLLVRGGYRRCLFDGINLFFCAEEHPEIAARISFPANILDHYVRADQQRWHIEGTRDATLLGCWRKALEFSRRIARVDLGHPDQGASARAVPPALPARSQSDALIVDVTMLVDAKVITGIQRVTLNIVACLKRLENQLGCRLVFARRTSHALLQVDVRLDPGDGPDRLRLLPTQAPVEIRRRDRMLFCELDHGLVRYAPVLRRLRGGGVQITFWVYDIFPMAHPEWSSAQEAIGHAQWWELITEVAERIVCDSWKALVEVREWLALFPPKGRRGAASPELRWLHLGADGLDNVTISELEHAVTSDDGAVAPRIGAGTTFLCVASLHPRKAFDIVLDAFDELWAAGDEVDLVISGFSWKGSPGAVMNRIRNHPRLGTHLHYRGYLSDEQVRRLYRSCDALIYPSHDEGFGLPVVEAARYGLPSVLRDIPVLREVSGEHGFWFADAGSPSLAQALREVHRATPEQRRARVTPLRDLLGWAQVTDHLVDALGIARTPRAPTALSTPDASSRANQR